MSSLSNLIVQSDLQQNSEMLGSDRSSILSIETGVHEKTKETIGASSADEEIGDNSSDVEDHYSANDKEGQCSNDLQMPKRQYSREVLLQLKESPTSNIFPSCLEKSPKSILASHLQGKDQNSDKKSNEPTNEDNSNDVKRKQFKKKNAAEKDESGVGKKHLNVQDRLKKEEIVLSPQRNSFNAGCSGSSSICNSLPNRTTITTTRHRLDSLSSSKEVRDSELSNEHRKQRLDSLAQNQPRDFSQLSRDANNRRLNRGRLMSRDSTWESTRDLDASLNYGYDKRVMNNSGGGGVRRQNNEEERNRYGYFDRKKNYNDDHVRIEKEPEWFSAGPTSQYDVIELQGFEDFRNEMKSKKGKKSEATSKMTESSANTAKAKTKETPSSDSNKSESNKQKKMSVKEPTESSLRVKRDSPLKPETNTPTESESNKKQSSDLLNDTSASPTLPDDLDVFLNFSNLLVDDDTEITKSGTSKFSRWFQPESSSNNVINWVPDKNQASEFSTTNSNAFGGMFPDKAISEVKQVSENKPHVDSWPSFTENSSSTEKPDSSGKNILERLLMASPSPAPSGNVSTVGKVHSVEELEAHIRKPQNSKNDEDMVAFKRLFNQTKSASIGSANPVSSAFNNANQIPSKPAVVQQQQPQPRVADLLQQQQQQFGFQQANFQVIAPDPAETAKLQRHRNLEDLMSMVAIEFRKHQVSKPTEMPPPPPIGAPVILPQPAPIVENHPFIRSTVDSTLQKPEAQVLLQALKLGQITVGQLLDKNHPLVPPYRDVVSGVLKYWLQHTARQDGGNIPLNTITPQPFPIVQRPNERFVQPLLVPPTIQPEAVTQLNVPMQAAFKQRIPSPQEIAIHTQGIMHNALVKKKMEEQRENYKRRQEMWRARSPATDDSPAAQQLLSTFTPTSVLRQQKRKPENNPAGGDQLFRANDVLQQQQQQLNLQIQQQQAKTYDMFMNKGRPIIKKSDANQFHTIETPYPVHPGQFRSQTTAPPNAAQNFLAGFVHPHESQQQLQQQQQQQQPQQSHFAATNLASATACLQGLLLDNRGGGMPRQQDSMTSHQGGGFAGDEGGPLSRWFPTKLIEDGLAGKLPDIPTQKMMSVEELERLQSVHN